MLGMINIIPSNVIYTQMRSNRNIALDSAIHTNYLTVSAITDATTDAALTMVLITLRLYPLF